jgi:hypothetical protein
VTTVGTAAGGCSNWRLSGAWEVPPVRRVTSEPRTEAGVVVVTGCDDVVVVVDTSASADDAARQQKAGAAEAVLRAMSSSDHFALIALDAAPRVLYPKEGLAEASARPGDQCNRHGVSLRFR